MKNQKSDQRPDCSSTDHYTSKATEEAREEAFANLRALVALLVRIDERLAIEDEERHDAGK